jgi:hypothetical protein
MHWPHKNFEISLTSKTYFYFVSAHQLRITPVDFIWFFLRIDRRAARVNVILEFAYQSMLCIGRFHLGFNVFLIDYLPGSCPASALDRAQTWPWPGSVEANLEHPLYGGPVFRIAPVSFSSVL